MVCGQFVLQYKTNTYTVYPDPANAPKNISSSEQYRKAINGHTPVFTKYCSWLLRNQTFKLLLLCFLNPAGNVEYIGIYKVDETKTKALHFKSDWNYI